MFLTIVQPLAQGARDDSNRKLHNNLLPNGNDLNISYIPLYRISEEYPVGKNFPLKHKACQMKQLLSVKIQSGNMHTNLSSYCLRKGFNTVFKEETYHSMLDFPICKMGIILPQAFVLRIKGANTYGVCRVIINLQCILFLLRYAPPSHLKSHETMNYEVSSDISCDTNRCNHSKRSMNV